MKKKLKGHFFILDGNNGATYILNLKNIDAIVHSLKFYKARTFKQKALKGIIKYYLYFLGWINKLPIFYALKSANDIELYFKHLTNQVINFELDKNSSILISPTRDKIIIHHHKQYFHKFAFGDSYEQVKNEAKIYELLDKPFHYFEVSKFQDFIDHENNFCSFKLYNSQKKVNLEIDICYALVEMFNVTRQDEYLFSSFLDDLKSRWTKSGLVSDSIEGVFNIIRDSHEHLFISLGLVHRDFKPWNINDDQGLLIYDFEEAITDGLPLEDLFNYFIDPIVRYLPPSEVTKTIFSSTNVKEYKNYLVRLGVDSAFDFKVLLYCYLIERAIFWGNIGEKDTSDKYCALFEFIVEYLSE